MAFSQVVVTDQLIGANGQPLVGVTVTVKLSGVIQNSGAAFTNLTRTTTTDRTGRFKILLPVNTDEGTAPANSYYNFSCPAAGLNTNVVVSASTAPVKLASLPQAPSVETTGTVAPTTLIFPSAAAAPENPVTHQAYYDTAKEEIGVYTGTEWIYTAKL